MKLSEALESAFNQQITLEFQASLVYRQLAIELELMDLPGMAAWLRHQADEEIVHANKFIDHLADRDNHPRIDSETFRSCLSAAWKASRTEPTATVGAVIAPIVGWLSRSATWSMNLLAWTISSSAWWRSHAAMPGRSRSSSSMASCR